MYSRFSAPATFGSDVWEGRWLGETPRAGGAGQHLFPAGVGDNVMEVAIVWKREMESQKKKKKKKRKMSEYKSLINIYNCQRNKKKYKSKCTTK
eukprot:NODE_22071_length_724_cov_2.671692.p3 GENE.NODE_22071_length_724_cov_2.671692~~NODE_22071_length_724_cov_2.671692.p3  ORF type:complete len:94 (-),score=17.02 NODE_22071_length_724_cov_2.671692:39-320(-)